MISMNNQPGFIPVISMFPSPIYPQFIPTIITPMIPYNLLPPPQNSNYPPVVSPESTENYEMPPGLTDQNVGYTSHGPYYAPQGNNSSNQGIEGFNLVNNLENLGKIDSQDAEFASILKSVYKSVWDDEKREIQGEMLILQGGNIQPENWKDLLSDYKPEKGNTINREAEILGKLFENPREESRFGDDEEDQINGTLLKFNDFQVIKQRLKLMDSYKVELKEGIFIWETVSNDSGSNKEIINQSTAQVHDFDFGASVSISEPRIQTVVSNEIETENENKNEDDYVSPLRELLTDEKEEGNKNEQKEESQENCLQELMGKDLNDQKGADLLETLLQLQKQNLGPFLIDYQILENTDNNNNSTIPKTEDRPQKKSKKKRKNKNKKNTKNTTISAPPIIENPEQPMLSNNSTIKSIDDLEHNNNKLSKASSKTENNEESEVTKAKRILAELEDAINNLDNPKPTRKHPLVPKEDEFKSGGSERIETNHSASTDFGEQSSMESGKTDQKLSRAQKKKLSKKKKQHMQSINDYIESTSAIHKIDSNYIAMLSSVLAEDPFALVKLKEVVLAQNTNELGFTEEEIQEIEEVNLELEKTMKRTMNNKNESDDSEPDSNSYRGVDSPDRMKYDKYDELPEPKTRNMPLPDFLGEDFYKFHNDEIDILDEPVNISEADLTAISYLEELMKSRANFLADFGVSGFGPFEDEK